MWTFFAYANIFDLGKVVFPSPWFLREEKRIYNSYFVLSYKK